MVLLGWSLSRTSYTDQSSVLGCIKNSTPTNRKSNICRTNLATARLKMSEEKLFQFMTKPTIFIVKNKKSILYKSFTYAILTFTHGFHKSRQ
jgi:hypothetical protein